MRSTDQILQQAADDGSLDAEDWPRVLESVLSRLDEIINQFPKPPVSNAEAPPNLPVVETPNKAQETAISSQDSTSTDKENAPPTTPPRPPVPSFSGASPQVDGTPSSSQTSHTFPPDILAFYGSIRNTLTKNFSTGPPHTIQRLAELILEPKRRYRFLPSYLRALDRVVSVSSSSTIFPLPLAVLPTSASTLLNGATPTPTNSLGSDESLGGALLTPIPWLRQNQSELISESTEMVDGPNGAGRIETVSVMNGALTSTSVPAPSTSSSVNPSSLAATNGSSSTQSPPEPEEPTTLASLREAGGVTQGELLRQEQEAGVVPGNQATSTSNPESGYVNDSVEGEEELPHARGPEEMTMEDMGPQATARARGELDIEAAVGRPAVRDAQPEASPKDDETKDSEKEEKEGSEKSGEEMQTE